MTFDPETADEVRLIAVSGEPHIAIGGFTGPHMQVCYFLRGRPMLAVWGERVTLWVYQK